jgi:hypothetical protein
VCNTGKISDRKQACFLPKRGHSGFPISFSGPGNINSSKEKGNLPTIYAYIYWDMFLPVSKMQNVSRPL